MTNVILPNIGSTDCSRSCALVEAHPEKIVGSFWVMNGYGFDPNKIPEQPIPEGWSDLVSKDNQAQAILDYIEQEKIKGHSDLLYLGYCILVVAGKDNPANLVFVIDHVRISVEGARLLRLLAEHNIPARTEVSYPEDYAVTRPNVPRNMSQWTVQIWEDYCVNLLAFAGHDVLRAYWKNPKQENV